MFNEAGETIEKTIELPEEDYDVILSMFNDVEQEVLLKSTKQKTQPLYPKMKVEAGSDTVTNNMIIPVSDDQETYQKAITLENYILEKHPELKSQIATSEEYFKKEEKEQERQRALDELARKYPKMFKGRELSLEGIELIDQLLQPVYSQEETGPKQGL